MSHRKQGTVVCSFYIVVLSSWVFVSSLVMTHCVRKVYIAHAEQLDSNGLRCWDLVRVPSCGGRCDSREISDWQFPYKRSHHPVCEYGARKTVFVKLRHCDEGTAPGTDVFHYVAAQNCRCKVCSSRHTSCEWLPPNSTLIKPNLDNEDINEV